MSEAWHQHLNNLTWWEQLDRLWNPSKYSCTTSFVNDTVYQIFLVSAIAVFIVGIVLAFLYTREPIVEVKKRDNSDFSKQAKSLSSKFAKIDEACKGKEDSFFC